MKPILPCVVACLLASAALPAGTDADPKAELLAALDASAADDAKVALQIWEFAELGYQEEKSSALLQERLRAGGFSVEAGVAGMPTAFVAETGSGKPVVAILAEYDALPGLSQQALPERAPRFEGGPGHACGHHLFGAGSVGAALATGAWLRNSGTAGTLRVYGTPAEEGGAGKAYMARAGLFDDVDVALHWHPGDRNQVSHAATLANKSAKFRFRGQAAHASAAPERGRSALDGVEAMNHMVNLLREHVPESTRIHYVITDGGDAPNIVPETAEVFYYVRNPDPAVLAGLWTRVEAAARGAALGTGTEVEWEIIHGSHSLLPNEALAKALLPNLERVGGVVYDAEERAFAERVHATLIDPAREIGSEATVQPLVYRLHKASTDVGDVSWNVPTSGVRTATWVPGTPAHSWQAVAAGGMSIGTKGMQIAAKTLALTALDLFQDPALVQAARAEFDARRGPGFRYVPLLGDRDPPLDYRN